MFRGTWVALVTPFRAGRVDLPALERLVDRMLAARIEGLVPCGTTGESPTLTEEEYDLVVGTVVRRAAGRSRVVAGAGTNCTEKTVALARRAAALGCDGVMIVSPYYNRPTQAGLRAHFSRVAAAVDCPMMLYNIPGRTGVEIQSATIAALRSDHRNIEAVKHATGQMAGVTDLRLMSDITILSGDDPLTLPLMSLGAAGVVSVMANLLPEVVKAQVDAALRGDWTEARRLHERLYGLSRAVLGMETNPIGIKTALAQRGEIAEEFRLPMCPMSGENRAPLVAALEEFAQ